jgi:hypothetical protein
MRRRVAGELLPGRTRELELHEPYSTVRGILLDAYLTAINLVIGEHNAVMVRVTRAGAGLARCVRTDGEECVTCVEYRD